MKKIIFLLLCLLLLGSLVTAQNGDNNLYKYDSLNLNLDVRGSLELISENNAAKIKEVKTQLLLYPTSDYRQTILTMESKGELKEGVVSFVWDDGVIEKKTFGYAVGVKTNEERVKVSQKFPFPLATIKGYESYTLPTATIDSDNPKIIAKATELAQGENDQFKVAFKLASWVESTVKYDLNSLTAQAAQKASWVLENKEGVCDEMTSLFVAMARSLGMPARFVSGVSYTTSDLFTDNWQPHGWAEVYFPDVGWVSFDIAFGEYGYIDATHIKLRDGFDPAEPATKYEWLADKVKLEPKPLSFTIEVVDKGQYQEEEVLLESEMMSKEVGFGSYNLVKGIMKNTKDYYNVITLQLAVPKEIGIEGRNRRTILLGPKEVKETYWIVKAAEDLNTQYSYTFPTVIYSEKNNSIQDSFIVQTGKNVFVKSDVEKLIVQDEEKSYSRKVAIHCDYKSQLQMGEESKISCMIKNEGNTNLNGVNFCVDKVCEVINLGINQQKNAGITVKGESAGWNKVVVSAINTEIEKKNVVEYMVNDEPKVSFTVDMPLTVIYGENVPLKVSLHKKSFSVPKEITVLIQGTNFEQKWQLDKLVKEEKLELLMENVPFSKTNEFEVTVNWRDEAGKEYSDTKEVILMVDANGFVDNIKMFLNGIMSYFS